ncbi:TPA: exodeoxyribonuclease V subunit beta [Aeromonas hydrophila]|uniref:exodeoxyribonuclease V subunit beta n=1 Tax=Aeromonas TaxID=642 RepID=UPI00090BD4F3|nr:MULTISPECIES: exodeoxyribonuclease V subunit beta [Aeromonas]HEB4995360.1 exodeoxyribonuclease V subunit beta [Aeromonas hydrophila subsp. hydrophila]APJ17145.1 exodeoxyribonuclease V subunit beta [Aeromonas hydrophila]BBT04801.1 RecBCD enzyme subunit RecB [Aeromonas hydrophila]HEB5047419.1 exodeoxyribonuclease V subunit beta [Aeromonas hydrophila subsp. hydrophila]HEB5078976.1 exodeoxyribonuclease V subunit beta [Aeromonas hydrophila subsp. hydrophila]
MANPLNTLRFPLYGERLIEASAGTGKTYTIAGLYLRLLLGHGPLIEEGEDAGQPSAHERPLSVTEILVVTFTEAATAELRGRIRARIHEARLAFMRGKVVDEDKDPLLAELLKEVADHELAARRLLAAERQMDEAAVFTIHGFCQRMLKQNAFESGALFETEFLTDDSQLRLQAVSDYWRSEFYPVDKPLASAVRALWPSPAALLREMGSWLDNSELEMRPPAGDETLAARHSVAMARIEAVKREWLAQGDEIRRQTDGQVSRYTGKNYEGWLAKIADWAQDEHSGYAIPKELERFGQTVLEENLKKGGAVPTLPLFSQIDELLASRPGIRDLILQRAAVVVRSRMQASKRQAHQLSFDDLLKDLDGALGSGLGERLCERIRATYRVAMIDEFQDTDPQQYRIFHRLYGGHTDTALLMIGDPKQAIYGFRGADIFTYIQARRNVSAHYTLGRNWRSSRALVAAVNGLFERAKDPFIYEADIPFLPVEAQGKSKALQLDGEAAPVLHCWQLSGQPTFNKGDYQSRMARSTAVEIHRLLTLARTGKAQIGDQPVKAGDIAVLVRTGAEGKLVQQELARLAIASVYLSNRESVLAQVEAREILLILHACQNPGEERSLRAALATGLFDLDAKALDELASDERAWESAVQEFMEYRKIWHKRGVLAMLRSLLHRRNLASSLLASPNGERRLTNFLHLGELLQQVSCELDGEYALLRWLGEAASCPDGQDAEQVLRLESERKLVQIVTIHKSKGLEYPLVFLPFICSHRAADTPLFHEADGAGNRTVLDLTGAEESLAEADRERLAEDLRLLYVALTRGVYATWLGLAPVRSGNGKSEQTDLHQTAIGYLLQKGEEGDATTLATALTELAQALPGVAVGEPSLTRPAPMAAEEEQLGEPQVRHFTGTLERDWWISSYSGLAAQGHGHSKGVLANPGFDDEVVTEAAALASEQPEEAPQPSIFTFPKGARPGTLLHSLFETIDFQSAGGEPLAEHIATLLAQDGFDESWAPVLQQQVEAVLNTPLETGFGEPVRLRDLAPERKQVELEFFLPMGRVTAPALTALCQQHDPLSRGNKPLSFATVQGMLKGFIDLVFEWQGRWYLLDYKSNHLGMSPADYSRSALEQAMAEHRYDLQYQLYSLALHRLLALRLPGYDFEQHFGGVFYLFLRGMPQGGIFHTRPSRELVQGLDRLFSEGAAPALAGVSDNGVEA